MENRTYDIIKIIALIILPALTTFVGVTLEALNVSCSGVIVTIMVAFEGMVGAIVEKLSAMYKKKDPFQNIDNLIKPVNKRHFSLKF